MSLGVSANAPCIAGLKDTPMDLSAVPYMILSRPVQDLKVYICLCLIDHRIVGLGLSRDESMQAMIAELNAIHGDHWHQADDSDDPFLRN